MVGVGEAGYGPAAQALIAEFFKGRQRAFAIGIYSVGMTFGGVLGIWLGGVLAEYFHSWRPVFVAVGIPGFLLALLASRLREPQRHAPPSIPATVGAWYERGRARGRQAPIPARPLIWLTVAGALVSSTLDLFQGLPPGLDTAAFAACVSAGIIWTVVRLVPVAGRGTTEAGGGAGAGVGGVLQGAAVGLRPPPPVW